jgi:hypothetical protein
MSILSIYALAASVFGGELHLGALVGIQGSTLVGDDAYNSTNTRYRPWIGSSGTLSTGQIGMAMDFESSNMGVRLGAVYSARGWTRRVGDLTWDQHLNYLEVPVELHLIAFPATRSVRPYLMAGLYWGGLLNAEIRSADYPELNDRNTADWKPSAMGVSIGAGAQGKVDKYRIGGQIRLHRDLTVNFKDSRDTYNQSIGLDLFVGI